MAQKIIHFVAAACFTAGGTVLPACADAACEVRAERLPTYLPQARQAADELNRVTSSIIVDLGSYAGLSYPVCQTVEAADCTSPTDAIDLIHSADRRFGRASTDFNKRRDELNSQLDRFQQSCIDKGHASIKGGLASYYWPANSDEDQNAEKARNIVRAELTRLYELRNAFEGDRPVDEDGDEGDYD